MIAKTIAGLEEVLEKEIIDLGGEDVKILKRAVSFTGDKKLLYKSNYWCRTALRVIIPVAVFEVNDNEDLYKGVNEVEWEKIIDESKTIAVDAVVNDSFFTHSHFVALKAKDAIVDRYRNIFGTRPSVNTDTPDLRINIHIYKTECTVSLDSSGGSLHRRGYRLHQHEAPISEVLAAGLILLSKWQKDCNFFDPMCGSGTILTEAALIANNIPPGSYKADFGFQKWQNYDGKIWRDILNEAVDLQEDFEFGIFGSDVSERAVDIANRNIRNAKLHKDISVKVSAFEDLEFPDEKGIIVTNPPYGERIVTRDIIGLYSSFGDMLKNKCAGYDAWMISSDFFALKQVGLKPSEKHNVNNGQLECKYVKFSIYKGSKKGKYMNLEKGMPDVQES
jgi:putative N6-adenine-specific DNA methylase